jgi:hypothetical protein
MCKFCDARKQEMHYKAIVKKEGDVLFPYLILISMPYTLQYMNVEVNGFLTLNSLGRSCWFSGYKRANLKLSATT